MLLAQTGPGPVTLQIASTAMGTIVSVSADVHPLASTTDTLKSYEASKGGGPRLFMVNVALLPFGVKVIFAPRAVIAVQVNVYGPVPPEAVAVKCAVFAAAKLI